MRSRWWSGALLAVPGVLLAGFGLAHPALLDADTARWWAMLHILLLPVFPLLGAAQWILLGPAPPVLRWPGRLAAFGFATFYGGLDAVAGIAAGSIVDAERGLTPVLGRVFATGDTLGYIGTGCFLVASVLITVDTAVRAGWWAVPGGALLLAACMSFVDSHIFWPRGVFTMLGLAAGMFMLRVAHTPRPAAG